MSNQPCPTNRRITFQAWHFEFRACLPRACRGCRGFRYSDFGFPQSLSRRAGDPSGRIMRNEPNPSTGTACRAPKTQNEPNYHPPPHRKMRNEPNLPLPQPGPRSKNAKRTQFHPPYCLMPQFLRNEPNRSPAQPPNMRNEPNSPLSQLGPRHKCAKRTQFPNTQTEANALCINDLTKIGDSYLFLTIPTRPTPQKCETNPIYRPATIPLASPCPKNAKRTQS